MQESIVIIKRTDLEIVKNLHVFSLIDLLKSDFWNIIWLSVCMYVCMYVHMYRWMCALVVPELLDIFYSYSVFKSLSILGPCWADMNILVPNNTSPKTQTGNLL
jgi:hypothetical protein